MSAAPAAGFGRDAAKAAQQAAPGNVLEVANIEVIYNHVILVLKGVSLAVPDGAVVALLGANGAGKSTTLKAISNLLLSERGEVTKGRILCRGERVDGLTPNDLVLALDGKPTIVPPLDERNRITFSK